MSCAALKVDADGASVDALMAKAEAALEDAGFGEFSRRRLHQCRKLAWKTFIPGEFDSKNKFAITFNEGPFPYASQ